MLDIAGAIIIAGFLFCFLALGVKIIFSEDGIGERWIGLIIMLASIYTMVWIVFLRQKS